ncbi:MAG: serine/threonine protein phosphatase [Ruminococcaceae bacterium]|nr:serine/threonine protein phosphatase [Oscillospiraceae bacterium]
MSLYALSDLHLSFSDNKSMEIFRGWDNYIERIEKNWRHLITEDDTVVINGDVSWALSLEGAVRDFAFIEGLPGKKIISKGNHDYWWNTMSKMKKFLEENNFSSISILHNNCIETEKFAVCGTRGWVYDGSGEFDEKVIARECARLETSIKAAQQTELMPAVFLHYPPVYGEEVCSEILSVLKMHNIEQIYYGHIHGAGRNQSVSEYDGIKMRLVSCDCVDFTPVFVG